MSEMSQKQRSLVMAGNLCLMFALAAYGLSLNTIQGPILKSLGGESSFSIITVLSSIALCVMIPVGGRLSDMIGGKKLILYAGIINIASGLLMALVPNLIVFIICRILLAASQGAYASLPFILVRQIYPPRQTPKAIGYLTMLSAVGSLLGSFIAGFLAQHGLMKLAIGFPIIAMAAGVFLISANLKDAPSVPFKLDWGGIVLLTISLGGLLMALTNGPVDGWFSKTIILSFAAGFAGLFGLIYWENKADVPLIPMRMLANREYTLLLFIAFLLTFYMMAMNVYIPQAVQDVLQAGSTASGILQLPMTIVSMIVPAMAGAWVVKNTANLWKSLAISAAAIVIPFAFLVFIGPHMPVWFIMLMLGFIGISNSFRSVGLMPSVQSILNPADMGVGTSLIGFVITLSGSVSSALFGLAYGSLTAKTPGIAGMTQGIDTICLMTAVAAFAGLMLVLLFFRPMLKMRMKEKTAVSQASQSK